MNILDTLDDATKNEQFIDKTLIDQYFKVTDNANCLKEKKNNPIYVYLKSISPPDFSDDDDKIKYASFNLESKEQKDINYIIFLNSILMDNYIRNLEILKENLLNDSYSIPVSSKSNTSKKSQISDDKFKILNKIKYNYNIENSSNSSHR